MFNLSFSFETNKSLTTKEVFHQSLVTLPSPHSTTARDSCEVVVIVSSFHNFSLFFISKFLSFNKAVQAISST
ncbi:MAG: hypothetical protein LBD88_00070 [Candidatus Peribacteria bacterium]|jgi:hypothetical protein|nr:hypothetical protein [Candidatus Peribacteria bacterium]